MGRRRWIAITLVAAWALLVVVAGVWSAQVSPPTVREQSELGQGRAALDEAIAAVVAAAGSGVTVEVDEYQVDRDCDLSVLWRGTAVEQQVRLAVPAGDEPELLDRLARRLPEPWSASHFRAGQRLSADAGAFVTVVGEVTAPGEVQVTVATGCRPGADPELTDGG